MSRPPLGEYIRCKREERLRDNPAFSVRQVAKRIGVAACYLSQVERGLGSVPTEERLTSLADALSEDPDILLAHAGKIASDLQQTIIERPKLFGTLIRALKDVPSDDIRQLIRQVRDRSTQG